jgi:hypothetical protein
MILKHSFVTYSFDAKMTEDAIQLANYESAM